MESTCGPYTPMDIAPGEVSQFWCALDCGCFDTQAALDYHIYEDHGGRYHDEQTITSTWSISIPTKKQLSLKILYYTVKLDGLPFYKLKERYKLKAEIKKTILIARIYGYYKVGKIK